MRNRQQHFILRGTAGALMLAMAAVAQAQVEPSIAADQRYHWLRLNQDQARYRYEHGPDSAAGQLDLQRDLAAQQRALRQLQMRQQREQMLRRQLGSTAPRPGAAPGLVYPPQSQIDAMNYQRQQQQLQLQLQMQRRTWPYPSR